MSNNNDNNYYEQYDENRQQSPIARMMLILLGLVLIVIIIFLLMKSCGGTENVEESLLAAAKTHYNSSSNLLPVAPGECSDVTLGQLESEALIKSTGSFKTCDKQNTHVQVCKLESNGYQYTPFIQCGLASDTTFGDWAVGGEHNLVADKSNVRFTFMPEVLSSKSKLYYPGDKTKGEDIKEYYVSSPASGYIYKDTETKGVSKWYEEYTGKVYWNSGALSSIQPSGYPNKGTEGASVKKVSETMPTKASYRTITPTTIYRTRTAGGKNGKAYVYKWLCTIPGTEDTVLSTEMCEVRKDIGEICKKSGNGCTSAYYYTCDGKNTVAKDTACPVTGSWSSWTTKKCTGSGNVCESKAGYTYTDKRWTWYRTGTGRRYIPSGAGTASGEKTYYVNAPKAGAKKDESTVATAYKYYKLTENSSASTSGTEVSQDGEWNKLGDSYLSYEELLGLLRAEGYTVDSLKAIQLEKELKYSLRLEYAHRK